MLKKALTLLFITSFTLVFSQESYYNDVNLNLYGIQLKNALAAKITSTHTNSLLYTPGIWEASKITDVNPTNSSEVLLIYGWENGSDGTIINDRERGIDNNAGNGNQGGWNREHVFSRSLGNPDLGFEGPGSDAHNLRPSDADKNSSRSNRKFGSGSGNSGNSTDRYEGNAIAFYPGDEWKGDVARMMMYMYLRYANQCLPTAVGIGNTSFTPDDMIDLFLKWNVEDPVSGFEKQRNTFHENTNSTYAQGNRNPFIDNPYLATRIWGGDSAQDTWGIYKNSDTQAPTVPANITLSSITTSSIDVSWTASTDNLSVTGYEVFVNGILKVQTSTATSLTFSDLAPNTTYTFAVLAKDLINNKSKKSSLVSGTTSRDTESPSVPTDLVISKETDSSFKVSWRASTDNTAVTSYEIYINNIFKASTAETSYTVTGLSTSTTYVATVLAKDISGNRSEKSFSASATTTDGSSNGATELFFSEYVEGSGNNKALEIANVTNSTISLSGYTIKRQRNGSGEWTNPLDLSSGNVKNIVPGDVFVVINGKAANNILVAQADITVPNREDTDYGAPINFNGNDPVGLFKDDVLIDIIGVFDGGSSNFAIDKTLRRKSTISSPNTTYDFANEWNFFSINVVDGIGNHTFSLLVDDFELASFKMYPNPVKGDTLNLIQLENKRVSKLIIFNIEGKKVLEIKNPTSKINLSPLHKGIYILQLVSDRKIEFKKIIKK